MPVTWLPKTATHPSHPLPLHKLILRCKPRRQEIIEQRLLDVARVSAREKLTKSEKKLSGILFERGVDSAGFAIIKSKGDQALFGGFTTNDMKRKLGVPATKPLADFLPTLTIKAKDFANELTSHNVTEKDLKGQQTINKEHTDNCYLYINSLIYHSTIWNKTSWEIFRTHDADLVFHAWCIGNHPNI